MRRTIRTASTSATPAQLPSELPEAVGRSTSGDLTASVDRGNVMPTVRVGGASALEIEGEA